MDDSLQSHVRDEPTYVGSLQSALEDLREEAIHRRLVPEANTIHVIVRHLRIEAE